MNASELQRPDSLARQGPAAVPAASPDPPSAACWNEIGVHGNGSCPQLQQFIRCLNCPVYSSAALQVLNRPLLPQYRLEATQQLAQPRERGTPRRASALVFRIQSEWFAMRTEAFQEVAEHRPVHSLPHRRRGTVLGLVNIRGELLICVSLGYLLGLEQAQSRQSRPRDYGRLLVTGWNGTRLAFPADEVRGLHQFQMSELQPAPATLAKSSFHYTHGLIRWAGRSVGLIDADRLFAALNQCLA